MSERRITNAFLEAAIKTLNQVTGMPLEPYTNALPILKPNAGNFHLSSGYNCVELCRMSPGGGTTVIFNYTSKRELLMQIQAYTRGFMLSKELAQ